MTGDLFAPKQYGCIMADPPWPEQGGGKVKRGADRHYPLMRVEAIAALGVRNLALDNAHLYLWTTSNYLMAAGAVVLPAWGFRYVNCIPWVKGELGTQPGRDGAEWWQTLHLDNPGLGQYVRGRCEYLLLGVRGAPPYRNLPSGKRAQWTTPVFAPRGEHSVKPETFRQQVELVSAGPYLELFARRPAPGWDVWGNEVASDVQLA